MNTTEGAVLEIGLVTTINAEHAAACQAAATAITHARRAGELLAQAKQAMEHGAWLPWLTAQCPAISPRTAQGYMRIAAHWDRLEANTQRVAHLPVRQALALLTERTDPLKARNLLDESAEWLPEPGHFAFGYAGGVRGVNWSAILVPSIRLQDREWWYVTVLTTTGENEIGVAEGTRRPCARAVIAWLLNDLHFPLDEAKWTTGRAGERWTRNQMLTEHADENRPENSCTQAI